MTYLSKSMQTARQKGLKRYSEKRKAKILTQLKAGTLPARPNRIAQVERKPIKHKNIPSKKIVRHRSIKKVSDKRAAQNKEYGMLRKEFLANNPACKIFPYLQSIEVHHTYAGAKRHAHFLDVETWLAVSRAGHNHIHDHPKEAREKGWLK